ncbi:MAG: lysophospholipid acyltransferase family protein [Planctomycetota bacterium]|nr:lysophospholipid acyltransferase family protein [Planctomycetota bacterium]MEE3297478.1 lysophospholipid acyltransferase family protein [Planctomycetota bacterium]
MLSRKNRRRLRNYLIGLIGPRLARIWGWSLRKRILSKDVEEKDGWVSPPGLIVLVWHQRLFTLATSFPDTGFKTLVSPHADGEMLAKIVEGIGHDAIRGSTTRRSVAAIRELIRTNKEYVRIGITPDGPRGPPRRIQQGAIYLASKTGLPILITGIGLAKSWTFNSWDRFKLPKPFSRILLHMGDLIEIPPDLNRKEIEEWRQKIERAMRELSDDTDERFEELYAASSKLRGMRRK